MDGGRGDDAGNTLAVKRYSQQQNDKLDQKKDAGKEQNEEGKEKKGLGAILGQLRKEDDGDEEGKAAKVRVVAYSDSDSDVEPHFEQVRTHLLPGIDSLDIKADGTVAKEREKAKTGEGEEEEEDGQSHSRGGGGFLSRVAGMLFSNNPFLTVPVISRAVLLAIVEKKIHPLPIRIVEGLTGGLFSIGMLLSVAHQGVVMEQVDEMAKSIVLFEATKWVMRRRRDIEDRIRSHVDMRKLKSSERAELGRDPESTKEFSLVYNPEVKEMKRILDSCDISLPERFGGEEFFRFAAACGILETKDADERAAVVEKSIRRVIQTVDALTSFEKLPEERLKRWERLVSWRGVDSNGNPVLVVRLGRALQLCTRGEQLTKFAEAIKSQMEKGIETKVAKDSPYGRVVVVVDCREITTWDAISNSRQITSLAKSVTAFMATHYPERLEKAFIVDVSLTSRMILSSVLSSIDATTRKKVVQTTSSDESLPVTLATLQKSRSFAAGLSSRMSDPSMATSNPQESEDEDAEASKATEGEEEQYHTPHVGQGLRQEEDSPETSDPKIDSYALQPTPLHQRGRLFSMASSIDSLDLASHLSMYPWSGLDFILAFLWQTPKQLKSKIAISPTLYSDIGFSRETSFCSIESPRDAIKGGLIELPLRGSRQSMPCMSQKQASPAKPSLRRDNSDTDIGQQSPRRSLSSHPLPRQSSVSWAKTLVNVKEIEEPLEKKFMEYVEYYFTALLLCARLILLCFT
ncbi:hypothetical protein PSENEW3n2_00002122 [Picochlorum sp. SENEW3]|nr:hypothetical protein PSENEW3n2_00002122 [Picochlorum sp. SENEW3]WPT14892.1 hypothetical protein PSENEW3_00002122 [Picochlorum sp. SENEW3]